MRCGVVALSDWDRAYRLYKQLKNGAIDESELSAEEYGLLYLYFPELLPDVDRGAVA